MTVNYSDQKNSPRNVLNPNLMSASMHGNPLLKNTNMIMLGIQETESAEDTEAQRNRNINLQELQSLFA